MRHLQDDGGDIRILAISRDHQQYHCNITEDILPLIHAWRSRPLRPVYPFVFIDALYTSVKDERRSYKKAIYAVVGIDANGMKDVLGFWQRESAGTKEWLNIFDAIKQRGVRKICFVSADGLTGIAEAARSAFGESTIFNDASSTSTGIA